MQRNDPAQASLPFWLVANRNFVLLWLAAGISALGDHLSEMALLQKLGGLERPDVTRIQALLTFGFFLPYVLLGPIAGWWADRFSRRGTMVLSDLLRAVVMLSLTFSVPFLLNRGLGDFSIVIPMVLTGAFAAFFSPCRQAMLPTLIREDQLVRANAMISAIGTIGAITSGWLGGVLVDWARDGHVTLDLSYRLDALTFAASAVLLLLMSMRLVRAAPHRQLSGIWTPLRDGFRYVRGHRRVLQMIMLGTVFWAAAGVVISVVPAIVRDVFSDQLSDVGMYRGLLAAGLALGSAVLTIVGHTMPLPLTVLAALLGAAFWLLALDVSYVFRLGRIPTGACLVLIGAHGAALLVSVMVVIQRFVPNDRRGRVFGVSDMCTMAAIVTATGLLGIPPIPNLDTYTPYLLAIVAAGMLFALNIAWRIYRREQPIPLKLFVVWQTVQFYANFWCRMRRDGACTIPNEGPVIVAANHSAGIDPVLLEGASLRRTISFLVAEEFYRVPGANWFMRLVDCIPVNRERPQRSAIAGALKVLERGGCLGIFPQGGLARPGEGEREIKVGVGKIALRTGATVIPCHISGTRYFRHPFRSFFSRHRARVKFGPAVDLSDFAGRERDRDAGRDATDRIMQAIEALAPAES